MVVRPSINKVLIWGRNQAKAQLLASGLDYAHAVSDLAHACVEAQVISCCTLSSGALVKGAWVKPNTHINLVGAYAGAQGEAGDLLQAVKEGFFHMDNIQADLHKLSMKGYQRPKDSITLFKSVGASIEDFVAARMVAEATR